MKELENLVKEMREVLKEVEKFEVKKNECKLSLELSAEYQELDRRGRDAVIVRKQNEAYMETLKENIDNIKTLVVTEPEEAKRKKLYTQMREMIDEKDFYELNMKHRITPVLVKDSWEIEQGEKFKEAHQNEYGRFSNQGTELTNKLKEITKNIEKQVNETINSHPFKYVYDSAYSYRGK